MRLDLRIKYIICKVLFVIAFVLFWLSASQIDMPNTNYPLLIKEAVASMVIAIISLKLWWY